MAQSMIQPIISTTPWRQLYQVYRLGFCLVRLPIWTILSIIPYTRLHREWTFKQCLTLYICHDMVDTQARVGYTEELTMEPGEEGDRFQVIKPFPSELYQGPLTSSAVVPSTIGGVWFPKAPTFVKPDQTIILWVHGGAFVTGNGRSSTCGRPANYLLRNTMAVAVFSVQYRLSGYGGRDPFPAALQDVFTSYLHLTQTLQIKSGSIVVAGNSSGANLVISFVRYIEQVMPQIGKPLCAVALSPWVAPLETTLPGYIQTKDYSTEYVAESFHKWGASTYQPPYSMDESTAKYITALGHPFTTSIPILVTFGQLEALAADISCWAEEMRQAPGSKIEMFCDEYGIHASIYVGDAMGWGKSAADVSLKIGEFIQASYSYN